MALLSGMTQGWNANGGLSGAVSKVNTARNQAQKLANDDERLKREENDRKRKRNREDIADAQAMMTDAHSTPARRVRGYFKTLELQGTPVPEADKQQFIDDPSLITMEGQNTKKALGYLTEFDKKYPLGSSLLTAKAKRERNELISNLHTSVGIDNPMAKDWLERNVTGRIKTERARVIEDLIKLDEAGKNGNLTTDQLYEQAKKQKSLEGIPEGEIRTLINEAEEVQRKREGVGLDAEKKRLSIQKLQGELDNPDTGSGGSGISTGDILNDRQPSQAHPSNVQDDVKLPPIAAGVPDLLKRVDKFIDDNKGDLEELDSFTVIDSAVAGKPLGTSAQQIDAQTEAQIPVADALVNNIATNMSNEDLQRYMELDNKATERKSKVAKLDKEFASLDKKFNALLGQTDGLSGKKSKDILARMRIVETQRGRLIKGYPAGIAEGIAHLKGALAQIERIEAITDKTFTGPQEGRQFFGYKTSGFRTKKVTAEEFSFKSEVNLLKAQLRKKFFGTAQTKIELKGSRGAIPEVTMLDMEFIEALKTSKRNVMEDILSLMEAGEDARGGGVSGNEGGF